MHAAPFVIVTHILGFNYNTYIIIICGISYHTLCKIIRNQVFEVYGKKN